MQLFNILVLVTTASVLAQSKIIANAAKNAEKHLIAAMGNFDKAMDVGKNPFSRWYASWKATKQFKKATEKMVFIGNKYKSSQELLEQDIALAVSNGETERVKALLLQKQKENDQMGALLEPLKSKHLELSRQIRIAQSSRLSH